MKQPRKLGMLLATFVLVSAINPLMAQDSDVLSIAEGLWELDPAYTEEVGDYRCDKNPMRIEIDKENMRYHSTNGLHTSYATITEVYDGYFWLEYDDEKRLDIDGYPVRWALVLENENQFFWIRNDWIDGENYERTAMRRRCVGQHAIS